MSRSRARTAAITYSCVPNGFDCSFDRAYTFSYVSIFPALLSMPLRHAVSSCSKTSASPPYASEPADRLSGLANMSFTGSPPPASAAGSPLPPDRRYLETNSLEREALDTPGCIPHRGPAGPGRLLPCRLAPCFLLAHRRFLRRGSDPAGTQLRDPADELHRNRFGEGELDRPLS